MIFLASISHLINLTVVADGKGFLNMNCMKSGIFHGSLNHSATHCGDPKYINQSEARETPYVYFQEVGIFPVLSRVVMQDLT